MSIDYIRPSLERISANSYRIIGLCDLWLDSGKVCRDWAIEKWYSQKCGDIKHIVYRFDLKALGVKYELHDLMFPIMHGQSNASLAYLLNGKGSVDMTYNAAGVMRHSANFPKMYNGEYRSHRSNRLTSLLISRNENHCLKDIPFYDEVSELYYDVPLETFLNIDNLRTFVDEIEWNQYYDFFKGEYKLNIKKCSNTDIAVAIFNRKANGRWCYRKKDNRGKYIYY